MNGDYKGGGDRSEAVLSCSRSVGFILPKQWTKRRQEVVVWRSGGADGGIDRREGREDSLNIFGS